ncbi:MAG: FAD-binding and (Fe-S)-binding domain-containing protein [Anaerolineae bacterium]
MIEATQELIEELRGAVDEVAFARMSRLLYSTDASNYQMMPVGVVYPRHADEAAAAVEIACRHGVPVLPRGGGSSLAGQAVNHALVLDFSRHMTRISYVDLEARTVTVEAGLTLGALNRAMAVHGLQFGPDPASAARATVGGVVGNNATGAHSIAYGLTADHITAADVVLADGSTVTFGEGAAWADLLERSGREGDIYRAVSAILERYSDPIRTDYPDTFRTVAGYNLNHLIDTDRPNLARLITGAEGTLGVMTAATLRLVANPPVKRLALVHFADMRAALEAVPLILEADPSAVELLDRMLLDLTRANREYSRKLTFVTGDPAAIQVVEFAGESAAQVATGVTRLREKLAASGYRGEIVELSEIAGQADVWTVRKAGLGILMSIRGDFKPVPFIEDAAVPVANLADYIDGILDVCAQTNVEQVALYAHASAGCLHVRPLLNLKTAEGISQMRHIAEGSRDLVRRFRGTISGEHGTGIARSEFIEDVLGPELAAAFREVKADFDPGNLMTPGKIVDPPRMDDESLLRFGSEYAVPYELTDTTISFAADGGFAGAVEMCNGAGVCRKTDSGVMCPSYMVTLDEAHSTRGRANALRAAMQGELGTDGMTSHELHEVLDLCLSCKACKSECPSAVDMARLKAAFMDNYHREHGVPLRAWVFAHIAQLNRLGQPVHPLANAMLRGPAKWVLHGLGVHPARQLPAFAPQTFTQWWRQHQSPEPTRGKVVYFHDTWVQHNEPRIGEAAVTVLEAAGYDVIVLERRGCCGRPALSKGMLSLAKRQAQRVVRALAPYARQGIPIVGTEPSCIAALTDEYPDLVEGAAEIAQHAMLIDAFIAQHTDLPYIEGGTQQVLFHGHCHQKALYGPDATLTMLAAIPGTDATLIDSTCCGMAGSFGYEAEHYKVSVDAAALRLVPAIRAAGPDVLIAATGTSCREQIAHTTGRQAVHPVELAADRLAGGRNTHR